METAGVKHCRATTRDGQPCRAPALADGFCFHHSPARAKERAAARRRGGKHTGKRNASALIKAEAAALPLDSAGDVKAMIADLARALVRKQTVSAKEVTRARCLGYLAGVLLNAIETSDLEKRIAALEAKAGCGLP